MKSSKIAIIHDYLREYGGAERVLEALHQLYPEAPVYVAFIDQEALGLHWARFADWELRETWLARVPGIKKFFSPLRVLAPRAFADLDLSEYDIVITSSNAYYAKAVRVPHGRHICYCHTPPRALYGYTTMTDWRQKPVLRFFGSLINHYLRIVDVKLAQRVDSFIANSLETQRRITKFYRRDSVIIHPPVHIPDQLPARPSTKPYLLYVNRLAFAKHPELAVAACTELNLPLKVVGSGPLLPQLQAAAGPTVEFLGAVPDAELYEIYKGAELLLYPVEDEDFGIVPVEAMGYGVPVVAHRSGGPRETVIENKTGVFFDSLTTKDLAAAITKAREKTWNREAIYTHAQQYSAAAFAKKIKHLI